MIFINKEKLNELFDEVYFDLDQVPIDSIDFGDDFDRQYDGYHFLEKGNLEEYIIEPFKKLQPKTYQELKQGQFFYAILRKPVYLSSDLTRFGILVNNRVFYIDYTEHNYENDPSFYDYSLVPNFILLSWLYRTDQWSVAESTMVGVDKSRLPTALKMPIHSIIRDFEAKKNIDNYSDFLREKFNFEFRRNYDDEKYNKNFDSYFQLLSLLDTRNTDEFAEKSGYQLFFSSHNDKKEIYIMSNADVYSVKRLDNAQGAIDSYAAHLFSGAEGEFDFSQYAVDF